jgi:hypothetical protein
MTLSIVRASGPRGYAPLVFIPTPSVAGSAAIGRSNGVWTIA